MGARVRKGVAGLLLLMLPLFGLSGCAGFSQQRGARGAAIGGAAGAGLGAAIGAAVSRDNPLLGGLVGAVAGGLVGAAIGAALEMATTPSQEIKDYQATQAEVGYRTEQGEVLQITTFAGEPEVVQPGGTLKINATYYIMTPDPDRELSVIETWSLAKVTGVTNNQPVMQPVGEPQGHSVIAKSGTRQAGSTLPVPSNAEAGTYRVTFEVAHNGRQDRQALTFQVAQAQVASAPRGKEAVGEVPLAKLGEQQPPTPPAVAKSRVFVASNVRGEGTLRAGPGASTAVTGRIRSGERFPLLDSREVANKTWHKIRLDDGREAWVLGTLGHIEE